MGGTFPPQLGQSYPLQLSVGGVDDGKKHLGVIYMADQLSKTTAVPVYFNYNLINYPMAYTANVGDTVAIQLKNASSDDYKQIAVLNTPQGAQIIDNTDGSPRCENGLAHNSVCEVTLDLTNAGTGTYKVLFQGIMDGSLKAANDTDENNPNVGVYNLTVQNGF